MLDSLYTGRYEMPPTRTHHADSSTAAGPSKPSKSPLATKPNRQQNTACAPCRRRRVRDDVRQVKPTKLLRNGRKIQELKPIYGIQHADQLALSPSPERHAPPPPSAVPMLGMSFFQSKFYRRFHIQRETTQYILKWLIILMISLGPVVDPTEFIQRFERHITTGAPLGTYGELIAKLLATWAASYGVNEKGEEEPHDGLPGVERRRAATNIMVRELLATIDRHGVLRSISWDGVRVLLLLLPLTEEVQSDADRAAMYQSTVLQVYSLSNMGEALSVNEVGGKVDQMVRARIFWYGHVHEGLTNGLKGRKLIFDQDDVDAFRTPLSTHDYNYSLSRSNVTSSYTYRYATAPIRLSAACRLVNSALTGPKARRSETVDRTAMNRVWTALAESWDEFESLRNCVVGSKVVQNEDTDRFISGWQIFIFEALNVIREKLRERIAQIQDSRIVQPDGRMSPTLRGTLLDLMHLHDIAESRCHEMLPRVLDLIRRHLNTAFFEYDASLCRDGVYYAGERIAGDAGSADDVHVCLAALSQMRWAYSKSTARTERLNAIWQSRQNPTSPSVPRPPVPPSSTPLYMQDPHRALDVIPLTANPVFDPLASMAISRPHFTNYPPYNNPALSPTVPTFAASASTTTVYAPIDLTLQTTPPSANTPPAGNPRAATVFPPVKNDPSSPPNIYTATTIYDRPLLPPLPVRHIPKTGSAAHSPSSSNTLVSPTSVSFPVDFYCDPTMAYQRPTPQQQQFAQGQCPTSSTPQHQSPVNYYQTQQTPQQVVDQVGMYYTQTFMGGGGGSFPDILHFDAPDITRASDGQAAPTDMPQLVPSTSNGPSPPVHTPYNAVEPSYDYATPVGGQREGGYSPGSMVPAPPSASSSAASSAALDAHVVQQQPQHPANGYATNYRYT
ncbi:hypothetical protein FRB99_002864 [Tulasnella sp. 403]|nr:hypothetical protein FRB99_002864 [Tulasnella sp. 403]